MRKIEKAKRYAEERDRIRIDSLTVTFDGDNNPHTVHFKRVSGTVIVISSRVESSAAIPWRWRLSWMGWFPYPASHRRKSDDPAGMQHSASLLSLHYDNCHKKS